MKKILEEKQIEWLVHFTRAENLHNIFHHGLLPKSELIEEFINVVDNDKSRYDNCENAICTTIEFPNYRMFYPLRIDPENKDTKWVVFLLKAKVIYDLDCAFCSTNAGNREMFNMSIEERKGKNAFLKLFYELPNGPTRKDLNLDDWFPTDPQAEVLVFDKIPLEYIHSVFFENPSDLNKYKRIIPRSINAKVNRDVFKPRDDWEYWKNK